MSTTRATNACEACRKRKIKCLGGRPCESCRKHSRDCVVGSEGGKRYSESYVHKLLARLRTCERELEEKNLQQQREGGRGEPLLQEVGSDAGSDAGGEHSIGRRGGPDRQPSSHRFEEAPIPSGIKSPRPSSQGLTPDSVDLASGAALHSHLRCLVEEHTRTRDDASSTPSSLDNTHIHTHRPDNADPPTPQGVVWDDTASVFEHQQTPPELTAEESHRLHALFMCYMGVTQHFLDNRAFTDNLTMFYRSPRARSQLRDSLWYVQYLLILAMGKLLDDRLGSTQPPGAEFFGEALRRLPSLHGLGVAGAIGVEVLALTATYLQWVGKKHDAYLYVGSGVRLAVALGYAQPQAEADCLPSEAAHRTRLFWTLYMLDRRLASTLGLPVGVNDQQVKVDVPWHAPGFEPPVPMCINIKIAQVTGEIMSCLYGNTAVSREDYVGSVEKILLDLRGIPPMMPEEYKIHFESENLVVTRTGASLYLMYYQAALLCLRPIILQQVRLKVKKANEAAPQSQTRTNGTPRKLVYLGRDAAIKSIRILSALQAENLIARFGFFDLDATFSAAFILVMIGILEGTTALELPKEIQLACQVLLYLSEAGNCVASEKLDDIVRFCASIWGVPEEAILPGRGYVVDNRTGYAGAGPMDRGQVNGAFAFPYAETSVASGANTLQHDGFHDAGSEMAPIPPSSQQDFGSLDIPYGDLVAPLGPPGDSFTNEAQCIYTSFNEADFSLTGFDHGDWMEMEKVLGGNF